MSEPSMQPEEPVWTGQMIAVCGNEWETEGTNSLGFAEDQTRVCDFEGIVDAYRYPMEETRYECPKCQNERLVEEERP